MADLEGSGPGHAYVAGEQLHGAFPPTGHPRLRIYTRAIRLEMYISQDLWQALDKCETDQTFLEEDPMFNHVCPSSSEDSHCLLLAHQDKDIVTHLPSICLWLASHKLQKKG